MGVGAVNGQAYPGFTAQKSSRGGFGSFRVVDTDEAWRVPITRRLEPPARQSEHLT